VTHSRLRSPHPPRGVHYGHVVCRASSRLTAAVEPTLTTWGNNRRGGTASMSNTPNSRPTARRAAGGPAPIFAAMERHRAARRGWLAAYDPLGVLQEMIPEARRRWQIFEAWQAMSLSLRFRQPTSRGGGHQLEL